MDVRNTDGVLKAMPWLTRYALMQGYKCGKYPAIVIGNGGRGSKLLWDIDLLQEAIRREMIQNQEQHRICCEAR